MNMLLLLLKDNLRKHVCIKGNNLYRKVCFYIRKIHFSSVGIPPMENCKISETENKKVRKEAN